jgi:hypothetical protein
MSERASARRSSLRACLDLVSGERGGVTVVIVARARNDMPSAVIVLALLGCGTVDPGPNPQVAEVVFDQNFYYCKVEPILVAKKCGSGEPTDNQGCHSNVTTFRFHDTTVEGAPLPPTNCGGGIVPAPGAVSPRSRDNWGAASIKMQSNPDQAPLLLRPTNKQPHPREIFAADSAEANVIRQWATQYSSR